jgi:methionine-rich copper-binding protein CopC
MRKHFLTGAACLSALLLAEPQAAAAHAIVEGATPAIDSSVPGPDVAITITFNSRIDIKRSRLILVLPNRSERPLLKLRTDEPDRLATTATGLAPGAYRLRWQVLAVDGHLTRGDIPFNVAPSGGK